MNNPKVKSNNMIFSHLDKENTRAHLRKYTGYATQRTCTGINHGIPTYHFLYYIDIRLTQLLSSYPRRTLSKIMTVSKTNYRVSAVSFS